MVCVREAGVSYSNATSASSSALCQVGESGNISRGKVAGFYCLTGLFAIGTFGAIERVAMIEVETQAAIDCRNS